MLAVRTSVQLQRTARDDADNRSTMQTQRVKMVHARLGIVSSNFASALALTSFLSRPNDDE